jgi:hypothetical protein
VGRLSEMAKERSLQGRGEDFLPSARCERIRATASVVHGRRRGKPGSGRPTAST